MSSAPTDDALDATSAAGLRYVRDDAPGIRRRRRGRGFTYLDSDGSTVRERVVLERIRSLAIPPAWTDVWICSDPRGHLQATGRDQRKRKQYRYHPRWRAERDRNKFDRLVSFGTALPGVRRRVKRDLALRGLQRERVIAAVVRLLEQSLIRIGNDEYARANGSFGLTTLRNGHAEVEGTRARFEFQAKSGRRCTVEVDDPRLAKVVRRCQELRGQNLFTYLDDEDTRRNVGSDEVNDYLREAAGEDFTAKDFRTWAGTVSAAALLRRRAPLPDENAANGEVVAAVEEVAHRLGNTPAVCRKFYVHPAVVDGFLEGSLARQARKPVPRAPRGLDADERFTLALLRKHSRREKPERRGSATARALP